MANNRQPKWDIYESVILLDGYLELQQKKEPRAWVIRRISADLRKMAINRGEKIDDVFRNENGISYQLQSMESAYLGHQIYVPATKLFSDTVSLYRENRENYFKLLSEAKKMITAARLLGMKVMIGCMTETSCAISAAAQLSPAADWADLDGNLLIANDNFKGVQVSETGKLLLPEEPGIGAVPKDSGV